MYIDIYDLEDGYGGIQRTSKSVFENKDKMISKYISLFDGEKIEFNPQNLSEIIRIFALTNLHNKKAVNEIVIFGKEKMSCELENISFLGFDVSGDSFYISQIKELIIQRKSTPFTDNLYKKFFDKLNHRGLFDNKNDAAELSYDLNSTQNSEFENDGLITPIWVYAYNI